MQEFNYRKTLLVGFGFLGISLIWPIFNQFIPIILQAGNPEFERQILESGGSLPDIVGFALAPTLAMFIMTWDNLINVFLQPWVGEKSDHTWNRFGRRKPWILLGLPIALIGFLMIPFARTALAVAAWILITNIGMAIFRSPTVAWLGDLFPAALRSKANGVINLMGGVGGLLAFFGGGYLYEAAGIAAPFIGGAVLMVVATLVALWKVQEPAQLSAEKETAAGGVWLNLQQLWQQEGKSGVRVLAAILLWFMAFNAIEAGLSSFAVFTLGISPGLAAIYAGTVTISVILFAVPAGLLGTKIGRKPTILIGLTGLVILLAGGYFLIGGANSFALAMILLGAFWALVNVNSLPLVYDFGDERKIGAYTGLYYLASQSAAVLGPTLGGALVEQMGSQYRWLFLFSSLFMALAWLVISRVRPPTAATPAAAGVATA